MPDTIRDGGGNGFLAEVDSLKRLSTKAVIESDHKRVNEINKESYLVYIDLTPTSAGDTFMYVKNTSTKIMFISWYRIWSGIIPEAIDIFIGKTGTPGAVTEITPINMNITSAKLPVSDFFEGVKITGLSGGKLLDRLRLAGNGEDITAGYPGDIIVPQGGVITLQALTGAIPLEVTLSLYYKTQEDKE